MQILFRYFLALLPPASVVPLIAEQRAGAGVLDGMVADARLHMTLVKWELRLMQAADLIAALGNLLASIELAACRFALTRRHLEDSARLVPSGRQDGLRALQADLHRAVAALHPVGGSFDPHVTLGYTPRRGESQTIEPIGWHAERLTLIESWHGAHRHRHVASWPLVERQGSFGFD